MLDDKNLPVVREKTEIEILDTKETVYHYPDKSRCGKPALVIDVIPENEKLSSKFKRLLTKTKAVKWDDFFEVERNKMVVYRIIPHSKITNNNKRLWRSIYKMYEMYECPRSRLERDGFKFRYREKDYFWFDVVFKQVKGEKKIEFYVATSEYQALKLKRKLENKMNATIKDASIDDLQIPQANTVVQDMKYLKHDIFSMNTNATETKTPISSILNTVDELQYDGDMARLSICNEAENRQKWVKSAQWAMEKLQKGKVPQRANLSSGKVTKAVKTGVAGVINEINDLLTDTFQAFSNVFFKSDKGFKKEKVVEKGYSLEDEISAARLSNASREKINQPVFKSKIRVSAHSNDKLTRETLGETLSLSMSELAENNELHGIKVKVNGKRIDAIREINELRLSKRSKMDADVNLISTDEMNRLALQMPSQELQRRYDDALSTKTKTEVDIPKAMRTGKGIPLGLAEYKDTKIPISMPVTNPDTFYRGYVFIGGQGAGKDTAIKNWIIDGCLNHGISAVIPEAIVEEGERGMADGIRDTLPPDKIIDIDLSDEEYIVPLDLTEVIEKLGRKGASRFADEVIDFFGDMEGLSRSKRYLKTAAKSAGGSLYNIKRIIEDESYRLERIEQLMNEGNIRLANELIQWGTNEELGSKADPVLNRLGDFFDNDTLFDIFAQPPKKDVDFEKWMKEGKVIIIRIPNRKLGELATKTLVHWVTLKTFMTRMLMSKADQKNGCFVVFNEPEQYTTEGLTKLMGRIGTEGRKERLGSLYAFHHWNKLPQSLQENLQGGGVQQFLFANDHTKTFELSKHRLEPTITIEDASRLPMHYAIVSVRAGKEMQNAFICHMKPPAEIKYDNSFLTKRHARMFGRKWEDLQNAL
ncbi:ATP-binding protein [Desertibacillus haloalkaliphilus]|nr:ATP-binding protein [Desertibacillus haloalkaliphilus]